MAANNIIKVKTTRFPEYLYNRDKERYKDKKNMILKIRKAKKKTKKRNA
jgi:hypothetical protein|tara:strand:+ start:239 stop:385 length:147 start_codon:yes stop_codon:yes gene_type:complete